MKSINGVKSESSAEPFWCSIRVAITFLGFVGMAIHFSQKTNLSIGLVCMVNHSAIENRHTNFTKTQIIPLNNDCPQINKTNYIEGPFIWSKNIQGAILGAYFWGYIITQIPAGYLAGRFGPRFLFSGAILVSSLGTMCVPISARIHWFVACILQVIIGLAHGTIWPCLAVIMAHWAPVNERGKLMGFIIAGSQVGNIFILSIGGLMCSWSFAGGWPLIFYTTSIIGLIWSVIWYLFYTNSPRDHRYISTEEKEFILQNTQQQQWSDKNKREFHAPWRAILTSPACWALFIVHTCYSYAAYTFLTSTPKYMNEVLKFDIKSNGFLSSLPCFGLWLITNFSGFIADILVRRKISTVTRTRKLFTALGTLLPGIFIIALAFMTCQLKYLAVIFLTLSTAFCGFASGGGFFLVANDMAPAYAGIVFGISNTFATVTGIVSPYVVGALTEKDPNNWRFVFFICAGICLIGTIVFTSLGSSEVQPWGINKTKNNPVNDNLLSKENRETSLNVTSDA